MWNEEIMSVKNWIVNQVNVLKFIKAAQLQKLCPWDINCVKIWEYGKRMRSASSTRNSTMCSNKYMSIMMNETI